MVGHHPHLWAWALHQEDSKGWLALGTLGAGSGVGWGVVGTAGASHFPLFPSSRRQLPGSHVSSEVVLPPRPWA